MTAPAVPTPTELIEMGRLSPDRPTDWEVAFHEAGHVVAEIATGSFPDRVYLNDDGTGDHAGRTETRSFITISDDRQRRNYGSVLAAGRIAADIARGWEPDHSEHTASILDGFEMDTDDDQLRALAIGIDAPVGIQEIWIEETMAHAEAVLRAKWYAVERVAAALVEHRELDRDQLWDLFTDDDLDGLL